MNREEAMNDLDIDERTAMLEETLEDITEAAALVKACTTRRSMPTCWRFAGVRLVDLVG